VRSISDTQDQIMATQPDDFFFPKPYNKEQISIIQQIEKTDGVLFKVHPELEKPTPSLTLFATIWPPGVECWLPPREKRH